MNNTAESLELPVVRAAVVDEIKVLVCRPKNNVLHILTSLAIKFIRCLQYTNYLEISINNHCQAIRCKLILDTDTLSLTS